MKATRTKRTKSALNATLALAAVCLFGMLALNAADAAIIDIKYEFTSGAASATVTGAGDGNVSAADATQGDGITGTTSEDTANSGFSDSSESTFINVEAIGDTETGAVTDNDYFELQITVDDGYILNLDGLSFRAGVNENPDNNTVDDLQVTWFARSDVDSFAGTIASGESPVVNGNTPAYTDVSEDLSANTTFQGLTGTTIFRWYAFDNDTTDNTSAWGRGDDFQLTGDVSVIPEPTTALLLALGGLAALLKRRPRR